MDENVYIRALFNSHRDLLSVNIVIKYKHTHTLTPGSRPSGGVGDTASPSGRTHSCGDMVGDSSMNGMVSEPSWDFLSSAPSPS